MVNVIRSEIFKSLKSTYFRICLIGGSIFIAIAVLFIPQIASIVGFSIETRVDLPKIMPFVFTGACVALMIFFPIFTDIFKYNTLKNDPRSIPLITTGKYLTALIFCLIFAAVFMASFTVTYFRLAPSPDSDKGLLAESFISFLATIPNYAAIIALIQLITVVSKNEIIAAIIYYYSFAQLFTVKLMMAGAMPEDMVILRHLTPIGEFYNLGNLHFSAIHITLSVVVGVVYSIVLHLLTKKYFEKRVMA